MSKQKTMIAPLALGNYKDYMIVGDKYVKNVLVLAFPESFGFGMLSYYISNPNIKVSIKSEPLDFDISIPLKKELDEMKEQYEKTSDKIMQARLEKQYNALEKHIQDIVNSNDKLLNITMLFQITTATLEEMNDEYRDLYRSLKTQGFKLSAVPYVQENLFKLTSPLFVQNGLDETLERNYGVPFTSTTFSGMWAYNFQTLKDPQGFLFGREINNHGMIKWDPMYYLHNPDEIESARTASNIVVIGKTGSGKTTDMNKLVRYFIRNNFKIIWIDPENKNYTLTKRYGGQFIPWGTKGNQINPLDLKPVSCDEDENIDPWDTEVAINNAIDDLKTILKLYHRDIKVQLHEALNEIDDLVIEAYRRKGIGKETNFKKLKPEDYPTLSDLNNVLEEEIEKLKKENEAYRLEQLTKIKSYLKPFLNSHRFYFDGKTTIHSTASERELLSFGTKLLKEKDQGLKDALNFIMFKYAWATCLDQKQKTAFIVDEAHEMILEGTAAKELSSIWRRSRKYYNTAVLGTQEAKDLCSDVEVDGVKMSVYGRAILNNSTYKIIKLLEKDAVEALSELIELTETEKRVIQSFVRGEALFVCGNKKYPIEVLCSERELKEMDARL